MPTIVCDECLERKTTDGAFLLSGRQTDGQEVDVEICADCVRKAEEEVGVHP